VIFFFTDQQRWDTVGLHGSPSTSPRTSTARPTAPEADPKEDPTAERYVEDGLYDLKADPYELVNLAGRTEMLPKP
jgi:arylsulfatase A-like enzyme